MTNTDSGKAARTPKRAVIEFDTSVEPWTRPAGFLEMADAFGLAFDEGDLERLGRYAALLVRANDKVNLTSIVDPEEVWRRHVFDSLTLLPLLADLPSGAKVVDVGSGGGTPGLVLAIAMPALRFTLLEATAKKAEFLDAASEALGLENVAIVNERSEAFGARGSAGREAFDAAASRALGRMNVAAELVLPLVKLGGSALFIKGQKAEEELEEAERAVVTLGGALAGIVDTPTGRIVVIEKAGATPREFPRRPGVAKKEPLQ